MDPNSKKVDPGWNDPPMLNYSTSNPPPKSRIGNKRIAFPLSVSSTSGPIQTPNLHSTSGNSTDIAEEKIPNMQEETFSNFNILLQSMPSDDTHMKIELMKDMWRTGQFPTSLKNEIYELSDSIVKNDWDNANKLHLKLLMNSSTLCKSWISATQYFMNNSTK